MRFCIALFLLFSGVSAFAATTSSEPIAALVTGDEISPGLVMASAEVVGLTDDGLLLTQGIAAKSGQGVSFVALLDKNNEVRWSISDGENGPNGGAITDVHASQLLFDGSFLLYGSSAGRNVVYRVDPLLQATPVFDCELASLNEAFCTEMNPPILTHDSLGIVLLVAENSAWRLTDGTYRRVFDFQVGDALPLGVGALVGDNCVDQTPISEWTLDGSGGVVAVAQIKPNDEDPPGPIVLRESMDGVLSVDVAYDDGDRWRLTPANPDFSRCGVRLKGVDLNGLVFTQFFARPGSPPAYDQTFWVSDADDRYIELNSSYSGAVSGLYTTGEAVLRGGYPDYNSPWIKVGEAFDATRMITGFTVEMSRGTSPAAVLELSDGLKVLVRGNATELRDRKIVAEGESIQVGSATWTVGQVGFTAFTAGLFMGSATSNGALAFVVSEALTGQTAIMRLPPTADFVVNSANDSPSIVQGECLTDQRVWDGRPECTVRAAFDAAATREKTSIFASFMGFPLAWVQGQLNITSHVELSGLGTISGTLGDLLVVQGGSLTVNDISLRSDGDCVRADQAEFLKFSNARINCQGFGVRSTRSGPVEIKGGFITFTRFGVYVQGSDPVDGPLLKLADTGVSHNDGGVYATGSITADNISISSNRGPGIIMDGDDSAELTLRWPPLGSHYAIARNQGTGVMTRRGKLIIEGPVLFEDNDGYAIDAAGPVEFRSESDYPAQVLNDGYYGYSPECSHVELINHEPTFEFRSCVANGMRLRDPSPSLVRNIRIADTHGPGILADGPVDLRSVEFSDIGGPGVFSAHAGPGPAVTVGDQTKFVDVQGPVVQTKSGDIVVNGKVEFAGESGGFESGGLVSFVAPERVKVKGLTREICKSWRPTSERLIPKPCSFSAANSRATTGTNVIENVDFIGNRGVAIWARSAVELRNALIIGNDGGVIASGPDDAIIIQEDVRILGNHGPGLVAESGDIKALAPFRVENNEGAGIVVENGDFIFENTSETPAKIYHNASGENCAPVGDQVAYPVYERCIRAGLFVPNGNVISSGLEVTENVGDGIAADRVELSASTVCGNSGAEIVARAEVLEDVDICNKIVERQSSVDDDGCSSASGFLSPLMVLSVFGFRRRRKKNGKTKLLISALFLLWSSTAFAATSPALDAALVTGDVISPDVVMKSAEVVGLTDDGQLLTQGIAIKSGQSVPFVALLDKNNVVRWSITDGENWPDVGVITDVHAGQLLFDGSFLLYGTSSGRTVVYRVDSTLQVTPVFDCELASLNGVFCAEIDPPVLNHDSLGTVLLVAEDSAWRLTGGAYRQVFDFEVGDVLPLGIGVLIGASCLDRAPISGWTLDGKGGVVAVVHSQLGQDVAAPYILRQTLDGSFSIEVSPEDVEPVIFFLGEEIERCSLDVYAVDLFGFVFSERDASNRSRSFRVSVHDRAFEEVSDGIRGAVTGLYSVRGVVYFPDLVNRPFWLGIGHPYLDRDIRIADLVVDVARGIMPTAILTLTDGSNVLVRGNMPKWDGTPVIRSGQELMIRSSLWTVGDIKLTAFNGGLYVGSATSNGAVAFVVTDVTTGKNAIFRVRPDTDFVVNSTGDAATRAAGKCLTDDKVWDGRPGCTVRAAFEVAETREHTSIIARLPADEDVQLMSPLQVSTNVEFFGRANLNAPQSDLLKISGGSLALHQTSVTSSANCISADAAAFMNLTSVRIESCGGFGIRSTRSGPVELHTSWVSSSRFAVYVHGQTPEDGPLLRLDNSGVAYSGGGIYATGSMSIVDSRINWNESAGVVMDGAADDVLQVSILDLPSYGGDGVAENHGAGIITRRGKLIIEGPVWLESNTGYAIDAAGPIEFRNVTERPTRILRGLFNHLSGCQEVRFVDHEPYFTSVPCTANGIRLRTEDPLSLAHIWFNGFDGPAIISDGPVSLDSARIFDIEGPGVFSNYSGVAPAVIIRENTAFEDIQGPVVHTTFGDVVVAGSVDFRGDSGGFDVGGNIAVHSAERFKIRDLGREDCKYWNPGLERTIAKKCAFAAMNSKATTGTNIFENVDFIGNRGVAIWARSAVELRNALIIGNDGGVIASGPDDAIIIQEDVRILGNHGPGLVAESGDIKALAPFRVENNEGAGIVVENGDFIFENTSETPAKIYHNASGENCAPVGDQVAYPVYERCIRAGLFVPNGTVISSGLEVTENIGDGIAADRVELSASTVCGNSGAEILARTEVLDDVDICNKIVERQSSIDDDGCSSAGGFLSPLMVLSVFGFRRRKTRRGMNTIATSKRN